MTRIAGTRVLIIATDGFEDSELLEPRRILIDRGADVTLASLKKGEIKGDKGATIAAEIAIEDVAERDFDALVLPGGVKNPDTLRTDAKVVETVRRFVESGRPVAAICHGPWLLAEAGVLQGRTVTSWPSVRTDLKNAGARVVDREAVTDGNLVTSRKPDDIPAFTDALTDLLEKADAPVA